MRLYLTFNQGGTEKKNQLGNGVLNREKITSGGGWTADEFAGHGLTKE